MKKFFSNIYVKLTVLTLLPICVSFCISWFFALTPGSRLWAGIFGSIFTIADVVALGLYGRQEKKMANVNNSELLKNHNELLRKMSALAAACKAVNEMVSNCSNELYQIVRSKQQGHCEIQNWALMKAECDQICAALYDLVCKVAYCGTNFSVNIIFKKTENGTPGFTMLSRKAYTSHAPGLYNTFVREEDVKTYHYKHLFDKHSSRPDFLFSQEEINAVFQNIGNMQYSQYIGIPVSCTGNKMIALLQIISYKDSKLACSREKLEELYDSYFCVFSSLAILSDKVENIKQVTGKQG